MILICSDATCRGFASGPIPPLVPAAVDVRLASRVAGRLLADAATRAVAVGQAEHAMADFLSEKAKLDEQYRLT